MRKAFVARRLSASLRVDMRMEPSLKQSPYWESVPRISSGLTLMIKVEFFQNEFLNSTTLQS